MEEISNCILENFKNKIFQYAESETKNLKFLPEVVKACEMNYCGMYNKTWMCPPAVGTLEELKKKYTSYKYFFVFTTKHEVLDSFDIEGMEEGRKKHQDLQRKILKFLSGKDIKMLGAGGCSICKKCTYPDKPCVNSDMAMPSMEASGISVVELAKDLKINYHNGENTVTYFSAVFFN